MTKYIIKEEILVAGIYPIGDGYSNFDYILKENKYDNELCDTIYKSGSIYISPCIAMCTYLSSKNNEPVYSTFNKETIIDLDLPEDIKESEYLNNYLKSMDLFTNSDSLEKYLTLILNNSVKFPIKIAYVYDENDKFITLLGNFSPLNIPSLLQSKEKVLETITKQNNRINSSISLSKVQELESINSYFSRAINFYYSSFSVVDDGVSFILLTTALESLLSLSTYSKVEQCEKCNQPKYKIRKTISDNVSIILMDENINKKIKTMYDKRSQFLHSGEVGITADDTSQLSEIVRKVLLMYWCVWLRNPKTDHKQIMEKILNENYSNDMTFKMFLEFLNNSSFKEKQTAILEVLSQTLNKE